MTDIGIWILFVWATDSVMTQPSVAAEFNSLEACNNAAESLEKTRPEESFSWICMPKN